MNRRSTALFAGLLVAGLAVAGCSSSPTEPGGSPETGGSVRGLLSTDPSTFNPATAAGGDDYTIDRLLYDSVLRRDDDGAIVGGLASSWDARSASEYVFTIRDDATCSDGTPITATVVADSLSYFADPATASNFRTLVFGPAGVSSIDADDSASTVTVNLAAPYANLERGLTLAQSGVICPEGLADLDGLATGSVEGAFSGPYALTSAQPGLEYVLTLREDYAAWPEFSEPLSGVPADEIVYGLTTDASTTANQLLSGDLDFGNLTGDSVERFTSNADYARVPTVVAGVYLIFNETDGRVFADQDRRFAAAQAVDRAAFDAAFSGGRGELFSSVVSPSYACVNTDDSLLVTQDTAAATRVLDGVAMTVLGSNAFGDGGAGNEYIAEALRAAGGDVTLVSTDNATWATTMNTPGSDWDVVVMGDINAVQVISASLLRVMGPTIDEGGRNIGSIDNPAGFAALQEGLSTADVDEQCAAYQEAQRTMLERVDVVPLTGLTTSMVSRSGVQIRAFGDYLDPATLRVVG